MTGENEIDGRLMRKLISRARVASGEAGKAGIAAALIRDGQIVAEGVNHVHLAPDPTQHAEIVAIGRAAAALGRADLSDCVLMSTLQPCEMCLAAARFAGIRRIVFAARQENVAAKYFAFPHLTLDDFQRAGPRFETVGGICEAEVLALYVDGQE